MHNLICAICERGFPSKYPTTRSCEACKQFFRRVVVECKLYECRWAGKCALERRCTSCRLDRCLRAGFNPRAVPVFHPDAKAQHYFAQLERRRARLDQQGAEAAPLVALESVECAHTSNAAQSEVPSSQQQIISFAPNSGQVFDTKMAEMTGTIEALFGVDSAIEEIYSVERTLRKPFSAHFGTSLRDSLAAIGPNVVLGSGDKYMAEIALIEMLQTYGDEVHYKFLEMELIVHMDLIRTMPVFNVLDAADQIRLINFATIPIMFRNVFKSAAINSSTMKLWPSGLVPMLKFQTDKLYKNNTVIEKMAHYLFSAIIVPFNRFKLRREEFVLLRAIIATNSSITDLSARGRQLLQAQSERYAKVLMAHEQTRLGNERGAQRCAEVLQLAECLFHRTNRYRQFLTYMAMVNEHQRFYGNLANALVPMCLHGTD